MITIKVVGAGEASAAFRGAARAIKPTLQGAVDRNALALLTRIRVNASTGTHPARAGHIPGTGPGPNVGTGDYRRSWQITRGRAMVPGATLAGGVIELRPATATATVETSAVQALRLEYGFVGRDALGRMYRQPAFPHVQPAADGAEEQLAVDAGLAVDQVVGIAVGGGARR